MPSWPLTGLPVVFGMLLLIVLTVFIVGSGGLSTLGMVYVSLPAARELTMVKQLVGPLHSGIVSLSLVL